MPYSWWTAWPRLTPRRPRNALAAGAAMNVIGSDAANSCGSTLVPARRRCSIEGAVQTGCLRTFAAQTLQSPAWFAGKTGGKRQTHLAPRRHRLGQAAVRSRQLGSAPRKQTTMCCGCMGPAGPVSTECDKRGNEVACRSSRRRRPRTPRTLQVPAKITYMVCINCTTTCTADTTIGKGREKCRRWSACSHDIYLIIANDNQPSKYPVRPHHSSGIETLCAPITY